MPGRVERAIDATAKHLIADPYPHPEPVRLQSDKDVAVAQVADQLFQINRFRSVDGTCHCKNLPARYRARIGGHTLAAETLHRSAGAARPALRAWPTEAK